MIHLTRHAIARYQERVENLPEPEIRKRLDTPAVRAAIANNASAVLLPSGHKVILVGCSIVTIRPKSCHKRNAGRAQ